MVKNEFLSVNVIEMSHDHCEINNEDSQRVDTNEEDENISDTNKFSDHLKLTEGL